MSGTATAEAKPKVTTAAKWGGTDKDPGLKRHIITLPSGAVVGIEVPDLPELIASETFPNELVDVAIQVSAGGRGLSGETTREIIAQQPAFYKHVIQLMVKEPEVDDALYKKLPAEDKEMLVEIATRQRDLDAEYKHIGGLHTSERWKKFRGLEHLDEDVASP